MHSYNFHYYLIELYQVSVSLKWKCLWLIFRNNNFYFKRPFHKNVKEDIWSQISSLYLFQKFTLPFQYPVLCEPVCARISIYYCLSNDCNTVDDKNSLCSYVSKNKWTSIILICQSRNMKSPQLNFKHIVELFDHSK